VYVSSYDLPRHSRFYYQLYVSIFRGRGRSLAWSYSTGFPSLPTRTNCARPIISRRFLLCLVLAASHESLLSFWPAIQFHVLHTSCFVSLAVSWDSSPLLCMGSSSSRSQVSALLFYCTSHMGFRTQLQFSRSCSCCSYQQIACLSHGTRHVQSNCRESHTTHSRFSVAFCFPFGVAVRVIVTVVTCASFSRSLIHSPFGSHFRFHMRYVPRSG
jgi:hypothetical protein